MKVFPTLFAFAFCWLDCAMAQLIVLDNFNSPGATGAARAGTSWVNNVTRNPSSITVGGSAKDDNGWGAGGLNLNVSAMNFIVITARLDPANLAPSFVIQLIDAGLQTQVFSVRTSSFFPGGLTLVEIPIGPWNAGFNPAQITDWTIGGGTTGIAAFRMTIDNLALSATTLPPRHSADTDGNFRLSLDELTRVIELYRTSNGTLRTGCYAVATGTEDGFVTAPARDGAPFALTKYHSADTMTPTTQRDGAINLAELLRVIAIYNYRDGTVRTGQYHVQAGTEDGFAPGP